MNRRAGRDRPVGMGSGRPCRGNDPVKPSIALFRGINVGGNNLLPMTQLVAVLESLGCRNVRTYIQSGNAVFARPAKDSSRLAGKIRAAIRKLRGFEPHVLVLESGELDRSMRDNPFPEGEADPKTLHLGFLDARPSSPRMEELERLKKDSERFRLVGKVFYLHAPEGVGRSRLAASAEKLLGVPMTDRNWRTVCKLRELANNG
jgi:uncharacterized protein (DUF1697 family)